MRLVVLCGPPGVGKLTIARELAARSGYRLFHNHLMVDLLESLFEFGSKPFVELRERYWIELLGRAADEGIDGVVFTLAFDRTLSPDFIARLTELSRERRSDLSFIELSCAPDELERRILAPERAQHGKLNSVARYRELAASGAFVRPALPDRTVVIDTTGLSVAEAAGRVHRYMEGGA
ncbi:MAG TPA: AAA family ATPase [Candidatus Polarisedimenticolaceae bacterium]|nr:AAA family ATPase [Candidatus Polarisedimenticolaceae bacterium]